MAHSHAAPAPMALPGVSKIVAIGSGKGGVGKTTVAVNLAIALSRLGQRVGLIDADIYGPNVPLMMGSTQQPRVSAENQIQPNDTHAHYSHIGARGAPAQLARYQRAHSPQHANGRHRSVGIR